MDLIQFRYSPYNEKVRWALDFKRVPHVRRSLLPGPHLPVVQRLTGSSHTPVLCHDAVAINGSARILDWLEQRYPLPALYPAGPADRDEALRIQTWFDDDITPRVRRAVLSALLESPRYWADVFGDGRSSLAKTVYACVVPLAAPLVRKGNRITGAASVADGLAAAQQALDFVDSRKSGYLAGDRFSLADLTVASALAVAVDPVASPMTFPRPYGRAFASFVERFRAHPGAEWVRDIYARHRMATSDFEGASSY
ncbi:MAG: glutathione S-transferase [Ramlibacter sp.]